MPLPSCRRSRVHPILMGFALACLASCVGVQAQQSRSKAALDRALRHSDVQWIAVAPHLPDPKTASATDLEQAADVLRARKLPEDALEYYGYALSRGGFAPRLLLKQGITQLELQNVQFARSLFRQSVKLDGKNPEAWNNLAATEYLQHDLSHAISDYKKAVKLNKSVATFHSNLGTAYFENKSFRQAVEQFAVALELDPTVFEKHSGNGVMAHMLSPADRGHFCYELAKLALARGDEEEMLHWLAKASESGFDLRAGMAGDQAMVKYRSDPRVTVLTQSTKALRTTQVVSLGSIPELKPEVEKKP